MDSNSGTSPEVIAAIAAGGAVFGALVGATAGGFVQYLSDRRSESKDSKVAARLVQIDLKNASMRIRQVTQGGGWRPLFDVEMLAWSEHKQALSASLSRRDFELVSHAVILCEQFRSGVSEAFNRAKEDTLEFELDQALKEELLQIRQQATSAYNVLADIADSEESEGTLGDDTFVLEDHQ